jgi:hypothetical protein
VEEDPSQAYKFAMLDPTQTDTDLVVAKMIEARREKSQPPLPVGPSIGTMATQAVEGLKDLKKQTNTAECELSIIVDAVNTTGTITTPQIRSLISVVEQLRLIDSKSANELIKLGTNLKIAAMRANV